jgi:hypothetical protein
MFRVMVGGPNYTCWPTICLDVLKETMGKLKSEKLVSWRRPPKCKTEALTLDPTLLVPRQQNLGASKLKHTFKCVS